MSFLSLKAPVFRGFLKRRRSHLIIRPAVSFPGGAPPVKMLASCAQEHARAKERLRLLGGYYSGKHGILSRRRLPGQPNSTLVFSFPRYITSMTSGYLIGSPVSYESSCPIDALLSAFDACDIDSVDAETARNAAIYGKGVEYVYTDALGNAGSCSVSPEDAFVVYADTVEYPPLFGMRVTNAVDVDGTSSGFRVEVLTREYVFTYLMKELNEEGFSKFESMRKHYFGGVPLIEYWNNDSETGDFEHALTLIDAYDLLMSDRVNDKRQFVDSLLVLYGCTLETDEEGRTPGRQLREDKAISLPDPASRVEWLCKQLDEEDTEVLAKAIRADIHKMTMVPDMTDERFSGNSSGVAMRYKLMGLEQLTKVKERWFREGLRQRLRLFCRYIATSGGGNIDPDSIKIRFTRSLPVNEPEVASTVSLLRGIVDDEMLRRKAERAIAG